MKKDDYFTNLIQVPPKQKIAITPFDLRTQRDAFSVSLEGLKGVRSSTSTSAITHFQQWNIHALVAESSQAREDRKRRVSISRRSSTCRMCLICSSGSRRKRPRRQKLRASLNPPVPWGRTLPRLSLRHPLR